MHERTSRLTLVPSHPAHLRALIEAETRFRALSEFPAAAGLRDFFASADVSPAWLQALTEAPGPDPWRFGFFIAERARNLAVGSAGFKGPPDTDGAVEIAYGVVPDCQGRGYATEAAASLVDFARNEGRASLFRAHTMPERNASTRVLEKCGFSHIGTVVDPEDGEVWRWERGATHP